MATEESRSRARAFQTRPSWLVLCLCLLPSHVFAVVTATILAGGETDLPSDTPSGRLDMEGAFAFVGALEISGGAALRQTAEGWELVGINTFTEGYGGRFGDTGGGVLIEPYLGWIYQTTGIPEPSSMFMAMLSALLMLRRKKVQ